jgi:hypothetical protein
MTLICYADESGTHDATGLHAGAEVATVAGYLSWQADWEVFVDEWQRVLSEYHVAAFHMSEFAAEERCARVIVSPYHGWSPEKRDRFLRTLISIARDNTLVGFSAMVSVRDYDEMMPKVLKEEVQHPYHFCFQLFFDTVLDVVRTQFEQPFPQEETIRFVFDRQEQFRGHAVAVYDLIRRVKDSDGRMGPISFEHSRQAVPLQAADLLASRARKMLTRRLRGETMMTPGGWDEALFSRQNVVTSYFTKENLQDVVDYVVRGKGIFERSSSAGG